MKKILLLLVPCFLFLTSLVHAESCSSSCPDGNLDKCISECQKLIQISADATKPHEQKASELEASINSIEANVETLTNLIARRKDQIEAQEAKLAGQQQSFEEKVRSYYQKSYQFGTDYFLSILFSTDTTSDAVRNLAFQQNFIARDKRAITDLVLQIVDLNNSKKNLEANQKQLVSQKANLEIVLAPIRKLVVDAKAYQSQLSQTSAGLSSRQQQLIAAKIGSLNLSRSAGGPIVCSDDRNIDPGFSPRLAFYTFGIPHRVGMSQYGAYGRAKYKNQGYQDILRAYFNNINFEKKSNITIQVAGYSSMSLEQYLLGIYEVPNDWPINALRAQAVAARSYALAYTNNGANEICTTQECQVYKGGNKGGNWEQAVKDTAGEVMTSGGQVIKAWYSSTDGGYTHTSAEVFGGSTSWTKNSRDTDGDVNSLSDLFSKAYDRESQCFYNAQGWRAQYNKSAWLKPEEVADIVNVILLSQKDNPTTGHLSQTDKPNPDGTETWDADRVKSELRNRGGQPFNRIDNVSMAFDFGSGRTTSVKVSGDAGEQTFDGGTFKDYFNVRAPANIAIVGPLYNIEKK